MVPARAPPVATQPTPTQHRPPENLRASDEIPGPADYDAHRAEAQYVRRRLLAQWRRECGGEEDKVREIAEDSQGSKHALKKIRKRPSKKQAISPSVGVTGPLPAQGSG